MNRAACSPFIKRSNTRQYTYKIKSLTSKIIDENAESRRSSIDIEEGWLKLNKDQGFKTQADILKQIEVFGQLKYFQTLIEEGSIEYLKQALLTARAVQTFSDEILFRQGNRAEDMYVLLEGKVNIYYIPYSENLQQAEHENQESLKKRNLLIRTVKVGEAIGNMNLYYNRPFRTMAICAASCKFLSINRYTYIRTLLNADKISAEAQFDFFRSVNFFSHWTDDQLIEVLLLSSHEKVNFKNIIFSQNQKSTDFYIIKSGQYGIYQKKTDEWIIGSKKLPRQSVNPTNEGDIQFDKFSSYTDDISSQFNLIFFHEYGPLDHFGQQDIMDNKRRGGFVICKSKEGGELVRIKSSVFIQFILSDPITAKLLLKGKIQDQILFNPQKRLQNFINCTESIDIDKYYNQIKKIKPLKGQNAPSHSHYLHSHMKSPKQYESHNNLDSQNQTNKGSFYLNDTHLDSPLSLQGDFNKSKSQLYVKVHSRNMSLPKISTNSSHYTVTSSPTTFQKSQQTFHSPKSYPHIPSYNSLEMFSPINHSPQILNKSTLLNKIQSVSQQNIKGSIHEENIFNTKNKFQNTSKPVKPYRLSDILH